MTMGCRYCNPLAGLVFDSRRGILAFSLESLMKLTVSQSLSFISTELKEESHAAAPASSEELGDCDGECHHSVGKHTDGASRPSERIVASTETSGRAGFAPCRSGTLHVVQL